MTKKAYSGVNCYDRHTLPYDFSVKGDVLGHSPSSWNDEIVTKLHLR